MICPHQWKYKVLKLLIILQAVGIRIQGLKYETLKKIKLIFTVKNIN